MLTTIDRAGRLVIPKEIRREANLAPGAPLEVRWREGRIEIEPAPVPVRLQRRGRLLVAVPQKELPKLTPETVEQTRAKLLEDRAATK
ncbi:MAG: AbrB/MazE/SpoVT family DNA-binding domain-containing protein [Betaproteobacteria bacterium]|nr:AbrB/MazE/SpoVT family DNA-binding domain-containing protein [Betaproteobacteria bacterium]